ncbi:MarR family transcriptional regulator [Mycolicibacterium komossense]|uniref:MarR family transcriptional regulator n=2 Tax=Mycolicibacterium komossense TaxID=1779 RepID=A0ABT3C7T0_9MYCO|nr:MarR family transcriptional regulator [Mycolicibacterium komossense]
MTEGEPRSAELDSDLQQVLMKLWLFLRRGQSHYLKVGGGLTMSQLSILLTLFDQGPMRLASLAARERLRAPTITVAIRRLEKLGLVERSSDPSDHRAVLIAVTPLGLSHHRQSLADRIAVLTAALATLSEEERDAIRQSLGPLDRLAELADARSAPTSDY